MYNDFWSGSGFPRSASLLLLLSLFVVAGCAVDPPKDTVSPPVDNSSSASPAESKSDTPVPEVKTSAPAAEDSSGFTIKEARGVPSEVRADFERAMSYLKEENYEKGIELLKTVTQRAPNNSVPHINLAVAYQKSGNNVLAEESIKKALAINPEHPLANNEYAMLQRKTGRFLEARETYEKTLKRYPAFLPARKNLAILCDLYMRDLECALKNYQIYSAAVPSDKTVRIWIADIEKRIGR